MLTFFRARCLFNRPLLALFSLPPCNTFAPLTRARPFRSPPSASLRPFIQPAYSAGNRKRLSLEVDGKFASFDHVFLRDACTCPQCVDPSTQQKLFKTTDIPNDIFVEGMEMSPDGALQVKWANDIFTPHDSFYSAKFLSRYSSLRSRIRARHNDERYTTWDKAVMEREVLWVPYEDYMSSDKALFRAVRQLTMYGLMFVDGIPTSAGKNAVKGIAERIGVLKNTFYGETWDVKSVQDSKNIAYTSLDLGLHMDLLYFESPPGVQFLHCLENCPEGGNSIFADTFRAATAVRMTSDMLFRALTTFPVTFQYQNDGQHYHFTRPTVVLDENSYLEQKRILHVNWAPPFQGPFEIDTGSDRTGKFRQYISAAKHFSNFLEAPKAKFEIRLEKGQCVVFLNRRVAHARTSFDPRSGSRWLKGAYVDIDTLHSKRRSLIDQQEKTTEEDHDVEYSFIR